MMNNMDDTIQQRIRFLNNQGVKFIRDGNFDDAIPTLADALAAIKQRAVQEAHYQQQQQQQDEDEEMEKLDLCDDEDQDYIISEWFTQLVMSMPVKKEQPPKTKTTFGPSSSASFRSSSYGHVHRSPIELPLLDGGDDIATMLNVQLVIVIFNLAMAFHLNGLDAISSSRSSASPTAVATTTAAILNAINMYELCYEMMGSEQLNVGLVFLMCLANNLGHCHALLNSTDKANKCFEHLLSMQMYLMDTTTNEFPTPTSSTSNDNGNDNDDNVTSSSQSSSPASLFEGFLQNTSYLILCDTCASAA